MSPECRNDQGASLAAVAFESARRDAAFVTGSVPSERVGLVLGNALAGQSGMIDFANDVRQQSPRFVSPIRFPQTVGNFITGALSRAYDIRGPNSTIANGSASGLVAIIEGCALLSAGKVDVIFAGGTERLTPALAAGLAEPDVIYSDGACLFVLERREHAVERGATVLATIVPSVDQFGPEPRASARATPSTFDPIRSVVGLRESDVIFIEHWIGRCLGALGAAAVAAAIGAARGLPVPCVSEADSTLVLSFEGVVITRTLTDKLGRNAHVVVLADSDGGPPTMIELAFPP
jgi:3-oxoacyl-[acyl-carrier-protein] synthase II